MQAPPAERLLVVNADDYGLTAGVSRAILRAHHRGIVTSTSVLALAPGFDKTVGWLRDEPSLGAGAHLALVGEDPPLLSAREIPTLVGERGRLPHSWRQFLPLLAAHRIDPADIRRELAAQIERIVSSGVELDHLDTHQNLHLWPSVRDIVLELGDQNGVHAIRITRSSARSVVGIVVGALSRRLERECAARQWVSTDASTGLDEAGTLELPAMLGALGRLAATGGATAELATHPGEHGDPDLVRYEWGYRWGDELDALCSRSARAAVDDLGFRLATFGDVVAAGRPA